MVSDLYPVINVFCLCLFLIILFKELSTPKNNKRYSMFSILIWAIILFCVLNCVWGLIASKIIRTTQHTFYFITVLLHISVMSLAMMWMIYVDSQLHSYIIKHKILLAVLSIPLVVGIILFATNRITGLVFFHKSFFEFQHRSLWKIYSYGVLFYYVIAVLECIFVYSKETDISKKKKIRAFFFFCFFPLIAYFWKIYFVDIPCKCMGYVLACLFIYIFNSTEEAMQLNIRLHEADNFKKIATNEQILSSITDSYECLYMFKIGGVYPLVLKNTQRINDIVSTVHDPTKIFSEVVRKTTSADYLEKMLLFTNLASLEERMQDKKIISMEFKGTQNEWCRASWIKVSVDEEGFLDKVLYAIQNIDEEKKKELEFQQKLKTALENQNEIYAEILQMQSNGILVTDMDENILTVNETALKLFHLSEHDDLSTVFPSIIDKYLKDKKEAVFKKLHTVKVKGGYFAFEFVIENQETENIYVYAESKLAKTSLGKKILITSFVDITKNKKVEKDLVLLSETDSLTQINNRGSGAKKIEFLFGKEKGGLLCIFDVDKFKSINDNYGHIAGDKVLSAIADCMKKAFRDKDVIMRLGGDEFAIYAVGVTEKQNAHLCIERFFDEINKTKIQEINNNPVYISLGAVFCTDFQTYSFDDYYHMADKAMYKSKTYAGHHYEFFE